MNIIHFKNQKDRLDFLKGNFEEIEPKKAEPTEIIPQKAEEKAEGEAKAVFESIKKECEGCEAWSGSDCTRNPYTEGCLKDKEKAEEKPKKAKKSAKKSKKEGKDDKVQAE